MYKSHTFARLFCLLIVAIGITLAISLQSGNLDANAVRQESIPDPNVQEDQVSREDSKDYMRWQRHAAELNATFAKSLSKSSYGGLWIDEDSKRLKIGVVANDPDYEFTKQRIREAVDKIEIGEGVDTEEVDNSLAELTEANNDIHALIQKNINPDDWPIQTGIKTDLNKLEVDLPADQRNITDRHRNVISEIKERFKDKFYFEEYQSRPVDTAECNWWFCNSPLRGGVGIKGSDNNYERIDCTGGLIVEGNSTGNLYMLTAGHCKDAAGSGWATDTYNYNHKQIGNVSNSLLDNPTPIDAMIINIDENAYGWSVMGKILKRSGDSNMGLDGYDPPSYNEEYDLATHATSVVGERVCISPAITGGYPDEPNGGSCGAVKETSVWLNTSSGTTLTHRARLCTRLGDSGSPIYEGQNRVKGILRAKGTNAVCDSYSYYTPMSTIINGFNGNISVY